MPTRTVNEEFEKIVGQENWSLPVMSFQEMPYELEVNTKAAEFIGSVVVEASISQSQSTESESEQQNYYSLRDAIQEAARGNEHARAMVRQNVASDVVERTIKSGHITKVDLAVDEHGVVWQHGQTDADIQANTLKYGSKNPTMFMRSKAETRNKFRIREAYEQGLLRDNVLVVFSRAPDQDEMSEEEAHEQGFFGNTMSCAIQVTSLTSANKLQIENGFVAGKKNWDAPRHDADTLAKIGDKLKVDFRGKTATEQIDMAIVVPRSVVPNGVIDVVGWWDECADGTFFGEDKPNQDYLEYREKCFARESELAGRIDKITNQLISEASMLTTPEVASMRMSELSASEMIEQSVEDRSIDTRVFGISAAYRIEQARYFADIGEHERTKSLVAQAKLIEESNSCPGGLKRKQDLLDNEHQNEDKDEEKLEDCEFTSKECPKCHKKNVKTIVKNGRYYGACGCHS